ncbi:hypothetical protein IJV79_00370 [bacterium]|nr:hypothetical protein [bacterium]
MKRITLIIALVLLTGLGFYIYKAVNYTYVTVKFKELRPFHHSLPVYYKGLVIGKATERKHTDDYMHTLIRLTLYPKNLLLPINTTVLLKKEKRGKHERDFLELVYPKEPLTSMLANGSELEGIATVDTDTFMSNQRTEELEKIKDNLLQSSQNLNDTLGALSMVFETLGTILKENQSNLYTTTGNLSKTTGNLSQVTGKVNQALEQQKLRATLDNIEASTQNLKTASSGFTGTVNSINGTLPRVDSTMNELNSLTRNANSISRGVKQTLKKPLGGLRLFFGKVIGECE